MATHHDVATWQVLHDQVEKLIILHPQRYFSAGSRLQHLRLAMQVLTLQRAAAGQEEWLLAHRCPVLTACAHMLAHTSNCKHAWLAAPQQGSSSETSERT